MGRENPVRAPLHRISSLACLSESVRCRMVARPDEAARTRHAGGDGISRHRESIGQRDGHLVARRGTLSNARGRYNGSGLQRTASAVVSTNSTAPAIWPEDEPSSTSALAPRLNFPRPVNCTRTVRRWRLSAVRGASHASLPVTSFTSGGRRSLTRTRGTYNNGHEGDINSSPAIAADGTIYFSFIQNLSGFGVVAAISQNPATPSQFTLKGTFVTGEFGRRLRRPSTRTGSSTSDSPMGGCGASRTTARRRRSSGQLANSGVIAPGHSSQPVANVGTPPLKERAIDRILQPVDLPITQSRTRPKRGAVPQATVDTQLPLISVLTEPVRHACCSVPEV